MKNQENLNALREKLQELTLKYGIEATIEQQKEVIEIGRKIEELESEQIKEVSQSSERTNIIVLIKENQLETWGSLTSLCDAHGFSYNYLKRQKFPFTYKGIKFEKVPFKKKTIL